jgi:hypothetical protein
MYVVNIKTRRSRVDRVCIVGVDAVGFVCTSVNVNQIVVFVIDSHQSGEVLFRIGCHAF